MSQQGGFMPLGAPVDIQHGGYSPEEWLITASLPATTPAATQVAATASRGAGAAYLSTLQGPGDEYWALETIYSFGTVPNPDVQLVLNVNGTNQSFTFLFSSVLQTNYSRPGISPITLNPSSTISFTMAPIGTVGGSPISVTFRMKTGRFKQ